METNVKLVHPGVGLFLIGRKVQLSTSDLTHAQLQSICAILKNKKIAATPGVKDKECFLFTEYHDYINDLNIQLENEDKRTSKIITLQSVNSTQKFELNRPADKKFIEDIYQKRLQIKIAGTDLWHIAKSPNVFYEPNSIQFEDDDDYESDISAFRRFYAFVEFFNGVGLGFGLDIGTSFFTNLSVEDYFTSGHQSRFYQLRERQSMDFKGTLLYKGPNGNSRCYFEKYGGDLRLEKTQPFSFKGKYYKNSFEYFKALYPKFNVDASDHVVFASFKGMGTVPVPAKHLYLAVTNENLNEELSQADKYSAQEKRNLSNSFWNKLGEQPFGDKLQKLKSGYYIPSSEVSGVFPLPAIAYDEDYLESPKSSNSVAYKRYFLNKYSKLKESGCFYIPPMIDREVHFMLPSKVRESDSTRLISNISSEVSKLIKADVEPLDHYYEEGEHLNAIYELKNNYSKGTIVFVFDNNDPSIYYTISQELEGWRIIRLTKQQLFKKINGLNRDSKGKGLRNWETYVSLNAFKIVNELGCIPYVFNENLNYEAQLIIDVSEKFRHFGLGLMIYKKGMPHPLVDFIIKPNPDANNDMINPMLLERSLTELMSRFKEAINRFGIANLLVLRDGIENQTEYDVFVKVVSSLKTPQKAVLPANFDFVFVEYHKKSQKSIRLFNSSEGNVNNPLEGSYLLINESTAIIANTGDGTLTQGTANPILIKSNYKQVDLKKVLHDIFLTSQLNFGSPRVAQRLTFLAKRIDDLLRERRAQEVIKIK